MSQHEHGANHGSTGRDLLGGVGALALTGLANDARADHAEPKGHGADKPTPFKFGTAPPRERKSFHDLSDVEVQLLCEAVSYMRDGRGKEQPLSVHHALQWDNLVATHAHHCTEAGPDEQVHWSWFFLPWHRAYLFFIERHLARVITTVLKNPEAGRKFALPYWDWVTHKAIPNTREREAKKLLSPLFGLDLPTHFDPSSGGTGDPRAYNLGLFDGYRGPTVAKYEMNPENEDVQGWKDYTRLIRDRYTSDARINHLLRFPHFC